MESAKISESKDRFIKTSISNLPENFKAKWEMIDTMDCSCMDASNTSVFNTDYRK